MLTDKQVKSIFRDTYDLFVKYKDISVDESNEAADAFAMLSLSENRSDLQTSILTALYKELSERGRQRAFVNKENPSDGNSPH